MFASAVTPEPRMPTVATGLALGASCVGLRSDTPGVCKSIGECTTREWLYGTRHDPVCGTGGSTDDPATLVCCFPSHTN